MNLMKFITQDPIHPVLYFERKEGYKQEIMNKKFLGLQSFNNIN